MTKEEAIERIREHMRVHKMKERQAILISEALDMAIEALELMDELEQMGFVAYARANGKSNTFAAIYKAGYEHAKEKYEVTEAEWVEDRNTNIPRCTWCGRNALRDDTMYRDYVLSNYCPNCGKEMR